MAKLEDRRIVGPVSSFKPVSWRTDIQGLRGLAVLLVVLFHANLPVSGGFIGVDVFFVISGYVITQNIVRRINGNSFSFKEFYWSRFRRLVPALSALVVIVLVSSIFFQSPLFDQESTGKMGLASMFAVSNLVAYKAPNGYFEQGITPNPLINTWSLSVEEQFYIGFTLIIFLTFLFRRSKRNGGIRTYLIVGLSAVALLSFVFCIVASYRTPGTLLFIPELINPSFAFFSAVTRAWEFCAGALLALLPWRVHHHILAHVFRAVGITLILSSAVLITEAVTFPGIVVVVPVFGTFIVILAGNSESGLNSWGLRGRTLNRLGDVSYSWYLWHWPMIVFAVAIFGRSQWVTVPTATLSLAVAFLSLRFIENPNRKIELSDIRTSIRRLAQWFLPPIVLALCLLFISTNLWFSDSIRSFSAQTRFEPGWGEDCTIEIADFGIGSRVCTWPSESEANPVYLVGDSVAGRYRDEIYEITSKENRPLTVAEHPGCPYLGVKLFYFDGHSATPAKECQQANTEFTKVLSQAPPGLVLLASSSVPFYSADTAISFDGMSPTEVPAEKSAMLDLGLVKLISVLKKMGHSVALIQSPPAFFSRLTYFEPQDQWRPSKCTGVNLLNVAEKCGMELSFDELDQYQGLVRDVIQKVANNTQSQLLDPRESLCAKATCSTNNGETWKYTDGVHLNVFGAKLVRTQLEQVVRK